MRITTKRGFWLCDDGDGEGRKLATLEQMIDLIKARSPPEGPAWTWVAKLAWLLEDDAGRKEVERVVNEEVAAWERMRGDAKP
jgi:hypothetical protein